MKKRIMIIMIIAFLILFVLPFGIEFLKDGGTMHVCPVYYSFTAPIGGEPWYEIYFYNRISKSEDGTQNVFLKGTEIILLGHSIYDSSHYEPYK